MMVTVKDELGLKQGTRSMGTQAVSSKGKLIIKRRLWMYLGESCKAEKRKGGI